MAPVLLVGILLVGGCGGPNRGRGRGGGASGSLSRAAGSGAGATAAAAPGARPLDPGYAALEQKNFNEALAQADAFLNRAPHGEGSAEAFYLRGRSLEGKNAAGVTEQEAKANLQAARTAYIQGLEQNPTQPLQSFLRAALGNVAYFQDDYPTAVAQLSAALDGLSDPTLKAWALYRIGLSQQRLGQFAQADQTFARVTQEYGNTEPARRAAEHEGARAFFVQLATFASPASAEKAAADLRTRGVTAAVVGAGQGRAILRVGPIASYNQAQYLKSSLAERFPDAVVVP